jgi:tetratricopeptide (TPR) repeat protein
VDHDSGVADTLAGPAPPASPDQLPRGAALDRYIVLERLGAGGMGVVYAAYDPQLDRRVAIKLVRHGVTNEENSAGGSRLLREAQAIARVAHPNVVSAYDVGTFHDHVFIAMELIDGETLSSWLRGRVRSIAEILAVFVQAGRGLEAAHRAGLVHRDFKPDNVLVGGDGRVRVVDFGLVQGVDETTDTIREPPKHVDSFSTSSPNLLHTPLTQTGALVGTPAYMAPEQFLHAHTDARSDQFSFCVALYEALFGERPFGGKDVLSISGEVLAHRVKRPAVRRNVPAHVRALVSRGIAAAPEERFRDMAELLAELQHDPTVKRRRIMAVVAALSMVVIAIAGVRLQQQRRAGVCSSVGSLVSSAWSSERRATVRSAFLATGAPTAEDAFAATARALDAYAGEWAAARSDACEATRVRGSESELRLEQRNACLDDLRQQLGALTDLLAHADRALVLRAPTAAHQLDPVAQCSATALTREGPRPPVGADARQAVAALRKDVARVRALGETGRYADAETQVVPLVARAVALHYRPVEAEALLVQEKAQGENGESAASVATGQRALVAALAGRDDDRAVRILLAMATNEDALGRIEAGLGWTSQAGALVERLGHPAQLEAHVEQVLGDLTQDQARWKEAEAHYRRALELMAPLPDTAADRAASHNHLALVYEGEDRFADALSEAQKAYDLYSGEFGAAHPKTALVDNNVGYYLMRLQRPAEARPHIEHALETGEAALGVDHPMLALPLNNLCEMEIDAHRLDEAEVHCERALAIRRKAYGNEHREVSAALSILGSVAHARGDYHRALALQEEALRMREKILPPQHPWIVESLAILGETELDADTPQLAVAHLARALALAPDAPELRFEHAWVRFLLARARAESHRGSRDDVLAAARALQADFAAEGTAHGHEREVATEYLAQHARD